MEYPRKKIKTIKSETKAEHISEIESSSLR